MSRIINPVSTRGIVRAGVLSSALIAAPAVVHMEAYANTLTRLIPDLYAGLDVVSRELVGFIPSAFRNSAAERAAKGQSVVYPISAQKAAFDVTPAMAIPDPSDTATGYGTLTITKTRGVEFGWTGEEQRGLNSGVGYLSVQADNFAQALRTLCNEAEADLALAAMLGASRAYGTAGATPFQTNTGETAQLKKILDDNGAPLNGRSLIIDTTAGAAMRTLSQLTKANEAGTTMTLRDGELLNLNNFSIKESAQTQQFVAGTNNGAASTNNAGYAVGATVITLAAAGTGTIKAGDVVTFAGDTANKYVVASGDTDVSNGGTITLALPGLRKAIPASNTVITTIAAHTANIAFTQNALHLVFRLPALPQEGDAAIDRRTIVDPRSGLVFEVAIYPGYRKVRLEVVAAWGVGVTKSEHIAMLLG